MAGSRVPLHAKHIGQIGAVAFALGAGALIGNGIGTASADVDGSSQEASASEHSGAMAAAKRGPASSKGSRSSMNSGNFRGNQIRLSPGDPAKLPDLAASAASVSVARHDSDVAQAGSSHVDWTLGSRLFAATPVIAYNAAQNVQDPAGVIRGTLNASQANGYALTYTSSTPQYGTVEIHSDGTFTYRPNAEFASLGGTDSFTVIADDEPGNPWHIHGLATLFAPNGGSTATATVTVLENPGVLEPPSALPTTDQLNAEKKATRLANSLPVQLAKIVLKLGWLLAGRSNFSAVGGPDQENLDQLDQAVNEYAHQTAMEVQLLDSNNPKVFQQVSPTHDWFLQPFAGSRIWYDNPDTIYRFIGVNNASSYVITGRFFDDTLPANTNFSVLTGLTGATAFNINGNDLTINPDGTFTITASSAPAAPGQTNHLQLPPGTTLITTRNTLSDWNSQEPMSLSVLRLAGPPDSLFSQIGGFAIPGLGPLVSSSPFLTSLVSLIPPLPDGHLVQTVETALMMLLLGISGENQYMQVATVDAATGEQRPPNVLADPAHNASFLSTQLQSAGYFQLNDDQALVVRINPGNAGYFNVPITNDWTITNNYWDEQTSLNNSQAIADPDGTYTLVISPTDPGVANWVSTGGLNQGTISVRFQEVDLASPLPYPTISTQLVALSQLMTVLAGTTVYVTEQERRAQIAARQLGYNRRYAPYPQQ